MNKIALKLIGGIKGANFGKFFTVDKFLEDMARKKMVFFGEIHGSAKAIGMQVAI